MRTSRLLRRISIWCVLFCAAKGLAQTQPPNAVPLISQVSPASIPPSANPNLIVQFPLTILGANFPANPVVKLTIPGGPSMTAAAVNVNATGTEINAFFNTTLPRPAVYGVTVANAANNATEVSNVFYLPITPPATEVGFTKFATTTIAGQPLAVATGDFNGDGNPDVAILSRNPNTVSIYLGNFSGGLNAGASYPVGNTPSGIVAADFNGDGILDLAVTNSADNTISIFLGAGYGTFQPPMTIADTGYYPTQIVAADFNGDGHVDLAVLNLCATPAYCNPPASGGLNGSVFVLLGNGDGTFTASSSSPLTGTSPSAMAAADFNSDGFIDLLVANQLNNNMTLLMGNGDGTFTPAQSSPVTGQGPSAIAIGDFNGDGAMDFAVTNANAGTVSIFLNQGCGLPATACSFSQTSSSPSVGQYPYGIAVGDMNADGFDDLLITGFGSNSITVLVGDGTGGFSYAVAPPSSVEPEVGGQPGPLVLADFSGDGRLDVLTVNSGSYTILTQMAVPQVILTLSNPNPVYGQGMTYTAQVNPSFGAQPTGTVTFFDGTTSLGTASLSGGYQANLFLSTPNVGTHQITATYNGDANFMSSTSAAVTETVSQAQANLTLKSDVNQLPFGQPFTLTATVVIPNLGTPTGTVSFFDTSSSTSLGTATVANSVAQLTLSNLTPGAHVITATYSGDANFLGSASPTYTENIIQASTATTISASASSIALGQTATFTATVQPSASTAATGFVAFFADGSTPLGAAPITNNSATLQTSALTVGTHAITAQYTGDANYLNSTSSFIAETVNRALNTVSLVANQNPTFYGQAVTFTAYVQPLYYSGIPSGTVVLADGSTNLGIATVSNGSAQFSIATLAAGSHAITATYSGDSNFQPGSSQQLTQTVYPAVSATVLTSGQNPSSYNQPVTLTASIQPQYGGTATGSVTFYDGSISLGSTGVIANGAALSVTSLSVGTHSITAKYSGDSNVGQSATGTALTQTVNPSPTTITLASNANPSTYGQNVTLSANVTAAYGTAAASTVSFYDGTTLLGTVNMVTTPPQITIPYLTGGTHAITAQYAGTANYASSTSAVVTQTVNQASTTTMVSSNANPSSYGQPVTLTATVDSTYHFSSSGGTVTFYNNGVAIGSGVISGNGVAITTSALATGANAITASYGGDSNLLPSTSAAFSQTVNQAAVSPTIALSSYAITYGQTITMTSTVRPAYSGTPTGTVTFWLNSTTSLGTGTLVNGTAQATTSAVPLGSRSIYATYNGDTNFASGSSLPTQLTVSQATTTTVAAANVNPANYGQTVTLSATVQSGGGTPTGTVTFLDGSTTLGTTALTSGVAQLSVSSLAAGTHAITAQYSGDTNFLGSTSAVLSEAVNQAATTTTLASSLNPAAAMQAVTFTATIQAGAGNSATGTVNFLDGSTSLGTASVANNSAQLTVTTLTVGVHSITAVYSGGANFAGSSSAALSETVNQASTTTTLVSNLNPATFGQGVPFVATVQTPNGGAATGTVTFYDGASTLGTATVVNNNSQHNVAQLTFAGMLGGTHSITAAYSGDANYTASTSSALSETINPASSSVSVSASANPASFGQTVTLTAVVVPAISGDQASGTVTFFDGSSSLGSANVSSNTAQISVANFATGPHSITASYAGDRNFSGSTSNALGEVVNPAATTTALNSSANPVLIGNAVTFTATVSSSVAATQSGTVSFYLDGSGTAAANVALSGGNASYSTNSLSAGSHTVVAVFASTNANFAGSTSATLAQSVADFTITVAPSSLTVAHNSSGTYTLTATSVGGFSGAVALTCSGAPANTTCAVAPTQVTLSGSGSAQSTATVTVSKHVTNGSYTLTFMATSGSLTHKQTATLVIN